MMKYVARVQPYVLVAALWVCVSAASAEEATVLRAGFESGHFDAIPWKHRMVPWEMTKDESHSGVFSARSGSMGDGNAQSILQLTYMCAEGYVGFAVRTSSGPAQRGLVFEIDGQPVAAWSGERAWSEVVCPISTGIHTFTWIYQADPSVSGGAGIAWIDDVAITVHGDKTVMSSFVPPRLLEDFMAASKAIEDLVPELDDSINRKLQEEVDKCSRFIDLQINSAVLSKNDIGAIYAIMDEVERDYRNLYGFMLLGPHAGDPNKVGSDNPVLYTAEYLQLLQWNGVLKGEVREYWKCEIIQMIDLLKVMPGLFNRWPRQEAKAFCEYFSHDEQRGLLTLDAVFDWELGYARELNEYGKAHLYCYDNMQYGTLPCPGDPIPLDDYGIPVTIPAGIAEVVASPVLPCRQPHMIELIRLAAGEQPAFFNLQWFVWNLRVSQLLGKRDNILTYYALPIMYKGVRDSDLPPLSKLWTLKQIADFYNSMALMYYDESHPLHGMNKDYFWEGDHPIKRLSAYLRIENPRVPKGKYDLDCTMTCDKDCSSACDCDYTAKCTKEAFGIRYVDPFCVEACKLACEVECVAEEKKCEAMCSLIENLLDL